MTMEDRMVQAHKLGRELAQVAKKARGYIPRDALDNIALHMFSCADERTSYLAGYLGETRRLEGIKD